METFGLFKLNEYIKRVIALNFPDSLWIKAEISQIKFSRGSYYLDLIEKNENSDEVIAKASGIIWFKTISFLKKKFSTVIDSILDTGNEIRIKVKVQFDERYGYSLIIEDLDASYTLGKAELLRQEIINRLQNEGLIEINNQIILPPVIQNIAVISSETAAGYQDFINHIKNNSYGYHINITLYNTAVQGKAVESELLNALESIHKSQVDYDCIIIIRGGGAKLDLAAFDNYNIAAAVAKAKFPVITGIGHEIDQSIVDIVSHTALKTPTAVADFILERNLHFESGILDIGLKIQMAYKERIKTEVSLLDLYEERINNKVRSDITININQLNEKINILKFYSRQTLTLALNRMNNYQENLNILSPQNILQRGFAIISNQEKSISSIKDIKPGMEVKTQLKDGTFQSTVN